MRVLVTGAYGLIGSACLARLHRAGYDVIGAGRSTSDARRRLCYAKWIEAYFSRLADPSAWMPLLAGIDAVVNCVGVLQDGAGDDVRLVQLVGTTALFEGCARSGVARLVHISAIGAAADGPSAFSRTKAAAEERLKALALDWVILRPALVFAPAVYGGSAMLRGMAAFPGCVPVIGGDRGIQVIGIDDLAESVVWALEPGAPAKVIWDVAHPQVHTLAALVTKLRRWLGLAPRRVLRLPGAVGKMVALLADAVGWLGWRSPARTTALVQLAGGVIGDPLPWIVASGIQPQGLDELLAARPASVQDRWFARLYLLKPLAIGGLAVAATAAGVANLIAYCKPATSLRPVLPPGAFSFEGLPGLIFASITLLLGLGMVVRRTARLALTALFVLTLLRAALDLTTALHLTASYAMPAMLALPSFDVPVLLAILFTLAILGDR